MKISILTPTYNRANLLNNLYNSILQNENTKMEIEWLIMDDGSTDETERVVKGFLQDKIIIHYFKQENQGKMAAINELMKHVTGDLVIDCDSDDYFTRDAFQIIEKAYEQNQKIEGIYGLCFLKQYTKGNNIRKELFEKHNDHV